MKTNERTDFISRQHPDLYSGFRQTFDAFRHPILQFIFDGTHADQFQFAFDLFVQFVQLFFAPLNARSAREIARGNGLFQPIVIGNLRRSFDFLRPFLVFTIFQLSIGQTECP